MKTLTFLLVALTAAPALAVTQWMDAAELDAEGDPLDGFVATRAVIDNRENLTDLVDVRFQLNWTGTATAFNGLWWSNPDNPWFGAQNALTSQWIDDVRYTQGTTYYSPTQEWGPSFAMWIGDECTSVETGLVPAGLAWDMCFSIAGDDLHLFQSPASAETSFNGETYTLYDSDPMPQTVPGPGTLALLAVGFLGWHLRRRPTP